MASRGGSKRNNTFVSYVCVHKVRNNILCWVVKEIINDLVSEAAKLISASRFCLCKIRNKTVENVLSSIDMETVAVA